MILKSADDKSKHLQLLEDLQQSNRLDDFQRKWLCEAAVPPFAEVAAHPLADPQYACT